MRILFLSILALFSSAQADPIQQAPGSNLENFIQALSPAQHRLLTDFLRATVESYSGYTLYGDKPMSLEAYAIYPFGLTFAPHPSVIAKIKGIELWKELHLSSLNREYFFLIFEADNYCQMVTINRRAFFKVVEQNISLFRYVLDPQLTPESLLQALISAGNDFYHVLKNDNTLLGILLGYGTQNAIQHARDEIVISANGLTRSDKFPFLSRTKLMASSRLPKGVHDRPSLGIKTLNEEHARFSASTKISRELKPFDKYPIPFFSCIPDSPETKSLLTTYEANRREIIGVLESEDFLKKTLSKLFATTSGSIEPPEIPNQRALFHQNDQEEMVHILTSWIHTLAKWEGDESLSEFYMQGVADREKNRQIAPSEPSLVKWQTERAYKAAKNLTQAEALFTQLKKKETLTSLIPDRVLYKTLSWGRGAALSPRCKTVSFSYSFRFQGDKKMCDCGVASQEKLEHLIPGVAHLLIGMRPGEQRLGYIHPTYGYGEDSFTPPNRAIVVKIHLIAFEPGDQEASIAPPNPIGMGSYKELKKQLQTIQREEFYQSGVTFWSEVKKSNFIDFELFSRLFNGEQRDLDPIFQSVSDVSRFVHDFEYRLVCNGQT